MITRSSLACAFILSLLFGATLRADDVPDGEAPPAGKIQVALLLDNSGSMSGLIDQAKTTLWTFINEFATTRQNGRLPDLEVALYIYGVPPAQRLMPLSVDLDRVSEALFAVRVTGGDEYCGAVIQTALTELEWSKRDADLRVIFIAGNEPFTQGSVDYRKACGAAVEKGVIVNTIHCGNAREGVQGMWADGAKIGQGEFMVIDHNQKQVYIAAPQDDEIARLNGEMNDTYVAFGVEGEAGKARQLGQDSNVAAAPEASAQRAIAKGQAAYRNSTWDLVDALDEKSVDLEKLTDDQLPEVLRGKSLAEKKAYLEGQRNRRNEIRGKLQELSTARAHYVTDERKKQSAAGADSLDDAMIKALRGQAGAKGFEKPEEEAPPAPKKASEDF